MVIKTETKFAVITPENEILNHTYSHSSGVFTNKATAERFLKKWIQDCRTYENNSCTHLLSDPGNKVSAMHAETFKQQAEMLETCKVVKIKVTTEVVA